MDRKNKISYQDDEMPALHMPRLEGKKARFRNLKKFNLFDKKLVFFFVRCVLLYISYKLFVYAMNSVIKRVNELKDATD